MASGTDSGWRAGAVALDISTQTSLTKDFSESAASFLSVKAGP